MGKIIDFDAAITAFGAEAAAKLSNVAATGEPEDQLRAPLESLVSKLAEILNISKSDLALVGESSIAYLKTRPDYAVSVHNALVGFIEVKAPGKGADPRRFRDRHDTLQRNKLQPLPKMLYTEGNSFSLWRGGAVWAGATPCWRHRDRRRDASGTA